MEALSTFVEDSTQSSDTMTATIQNEDIDYQLLHEFNLIPVLSVQMNEDDMSVLEQTDGVSYVENDTVYDIPELNEPDVTAADQTVPWGIERVQALQAHARGVTGEGVRVAVLDTGISNHPDLNVQGAVNFVDDEPSPDDTNQHGTHISGIALDNDIGVVAVAPDADLFNVKVASGAGFAETSDIVQGIEWIIENDIAVANMSLGSTFIEEFQTLELAVNMAEENEVVLVASSGNGGDRIVNYPAMFPSVIGVGSTNTDDIRFIDSQFGEGLDLMAPGINIQSTLLNGRYGTLTGTSQASPHVAGVAALVKQQNPDWTAAQVRERLFETATEIGGGNRFQYGNGLVNADAATQ